MKKISILIVLFSLFLSFNSFAMPNKEIHEIKIPCPENEKPDENGKYRYIWTWINDGLCTQEDGTEKVLKREWIQKMYDLGLTRGWVEDGKIKKRDTYSGKWSQDEDGTWSFKFDDLTIPIELTKIDGVLYAFNGYGELMDGYVYWGDLTTGADGVVDCDDPDFQEWLKMQYIPDCSTHKEETAKTATE